MGSAAHNVHHTQEWVSIHIVPHTQLEWGSAHDVHQTKFEWRAQQIMNITHN